MHPPTQTERQALNAAISRTTRRRPRKESTALPYPDLPRGGIAPPPLFWLAAWLRSQCEFESFQRLESKVWPSGAEPLQMAFCTASSVLRKDATDGLANLIRAGGLLFAWHGTTALAGFEVRKCQ